ncbi:MAG: desulfoferrodoxin [Candidatus Methanofastidiosia archaeon]
MTKKFEIYKYNSCGNIVEILHEGVGTLVCGGQPMELLQVKTEDVGQEKHVSIIEKKDGRIKVDVGSILHPMEEKHYIEWIQIIVDDKAYRKFLNPGDEPKAEFEVIGEKIKAREYCNIHGLWASK